MMKVSPILLGGTIHRILRAGKASTVTTPGNSLTPSGVHVIFSQHASTEIALTTIRELSAESNLEISLTWCTLGSLHHSGSRLGKCISQRSITDEHLMKGLHEV